MSPTVLAAAAMAGLAAAAPLPGSSASSTTAPASTGELLVICSEIGARVFVDGAFVGVTPIGVLELPPGPHRIEIDGPESEPFVDQIEVEAGQLRRLEVRLARRAILAPFAVGAPGIETGRQGHTPVITRWWFWGVVAVLGAAIVVTGVTLSAGNDFVPGGELEPTDTSDWNRF